MSTNKQALRMRNYLNTAMTSGVKLLHLTTDELSGLLDELEAAEKRTITVKLPADYHLADGSLNADMMNTCTVVGVFRDALAAAGITVKGE